MPAGIRFLDLAVLAPVATAISALARSISSIYIYCKLDVSAQMSVYLVCWQLVAVRARLRITRHLPTVGRRRSPVILRRPLSIITIATALLGWPLQPASAQDVAEAHGLVHGFVGMMNVIDHNTAVRSASARFGLGLYYSSFHPGTIGPEFAITGVLDAVSVNIAASVNGGVSYQIGERLSVGVGGTVLWGLKRWSVTSLDPHYGGYIGATWLAVPLGSWMALTAQFRQQVLYDVGERRAVFYPSMGIGMMFVPQGALIDFD